MSYDYKDVPATDKQIAQLLKCHPLPEKEVKELTERVSPDFFNRELIVQGDPHGRV